MKTKHVRGTVTDTEGASLKEHTKQRGWIKHPPLEAKYYRSGQQSQEDYDIVAKIRIVPTSTQCTLRIGKNPLTLVNLSFPGKVTVWQRFWLTILLRAKWQDLSQGEEKT